MKLIFGLLMISLILGLVFGIIPIASAEFNLEIEKIDKGSIVIKELGNPAVFDFAIQNNGNGDSAEIYSLVGVSMTPKGTFYLPHGKTVIESRAYLGEELLKREGYYSIEYQIKGQNQGIFKDKLNIRVVELKDSLFIENVNIHPDDEKADIIIKNKINSFLENVEIHFDSAFFDSNEKIGLKPFGNVSIPVKINKDKITKLTAGPYIYKAEVKVGSSSVGYDGTINYAEKEKEGMKKESSGFLIRDTSITKTNEGNVPFTAAIEINKDIISRLFTTYSSSPSEVKRGSLIVGYIWKKELNPGESFNVVSTTNYTYIAIIIILIVLIAFLVKYYSLNALKVYKSVSFVKTKGGEFALRVRINVKARKSAENIKLIDRLPGMTKLYEGFTGRKPDKIDGATRQLIWNIPYLNKGEERMFSYVIYSKLRTVGRFELPAARALFQKDGKMREETSNRAFFVSDLSGEE